MVTDHGVLVGQLGALGEAHGRIDAGIGEGHDEVHVGGGLVGQLPAHLLAALVDLLAEDEGVGAGKVDQFEDALAGTFRQGAAQLFAVFALAVHDQHLAGLDGTLVVGFQQVEGTGLGGQHRRAVQTAQGQGMETVGVAHGHHGAAGVDQQAVGAAHAGTCFADGVHQVMLAQGAHDEVHENFGIVGGAEDGAVVLQLLAQLHGVHQVAVVGDGDVQPLVVGHEGLGVARRGTARGGVTHMAQRDGARQGLQVGFGEDIGHQAHAFVLVQQAFLVDGDDARAFLSAMLLGVQTEIGQSRRFLMTVDTQKTTLVANHSVSSLPAQNALLSPPPCGGTVFPLTAPGPALQARRPTSARRYKGRVI